MDAWRAVLLGLAFVTMALAGCAGGDGGDGGETGDDGDGGDGGGGGTTTRPTGGTTSGPTTGRPVDTGSEGPRGDNREPTGSMVVSSSGGDLPLNVSFELEGSDPDGDAVTWTLDADGDGAADEEGEDLPTTTSFVYTVAGSYEATFTLSDGTLSKSYTATINVTQTTTTPPVVITGTALIPNPSGNDFACLNGGIDGDIYAIAPAAPGWSYVLDPADTGFGVFFWGETDFIEAGDPSGGTVPGGTVEVEICLVVGAPNQDYTFTMTAP